MGCVVPHYNTHRVGRRLYATAHSKPHNNLPTPLIEVFLGILESQCHEPSKALGPDPCDSLSPWVGGVSNAPGPSSTLGSLGPSHQWRHKSQVSLWDPCCAHGVGGTSKGEVHDTLGESECRTPLLKECPQHHGRKGDPGVTRKTP